MATTATSVAILVPTGANQLEVAAVITRYNLLLRVTTNNGTQSKYVSTLPDLNLLLRDCLYKDDYDVTAVHYTGDDMPPVRFMEFPWETRVILEHKFQFDVDDIPSEVCAIWVWDRLK